MNREIWNTERYKFIELKKEESFITRCSQCFMSQEKTTRKITNNTNINIDRNDPPAYEQVFVDIY